MRIVTGLATALLLTACGGSDAEGENAEATIERVANARAGQMLAGEWTNTVTLEKFEIPGAPPEMEAMLRARFEQANGGTSCLTQEQLDEGMEARAKEALKGKDCTTTGFDGEPGVVDGTMQCMMDGGIAANIAVSGQYAAESMTMSLGITMEQDSIPGGEALMGLKVSSKRIGDCPA